jgi:hypothetical protein
MYVMLSVFSHISVTLCIFIIKEIVMPIQIDFVAVVGQKCY